MSKINTKILVFTNTTVTPIDQVTGLKTTPLNSSSTISCTIPRGKLSNVAPTGLKLISGRFPLFGSRDIIRTELNGNITFRAGTYQLNVTFNSITAPLPVANTNIAPPVNITDNNDIAEMIQSTVNAASDAIPASVIAFGGISPFVVTWFPRSVTAGSIGYFIFTNIYNTKFALDFRNANVITGTTNGSMGILLGFGNSLTTEATTHQSLSTTVDNSAFDPSADNRNALMVSCEFGIQGLSTGTIILNGAETEKNILALVPYTNERFDYVNKPNDNYVFINNSIFFDRIKGNTYGINGTSDPGYSATNQPIIREISGEAFNDPLFRIVFFDTSGHPVWIDPTGVRAPIYIKFAAMFNDTMTPVVRVM